MSLTPKGGLPYVWVTWITGLLAGEKQCQYQPWVKANFRYTKRPDATFDRAAWSADHAALVTERAAQLVEDGWRVRIENQNAFKLKGKTAWLSGQPDIVAFKGDTALIVDAKTGQQRYSDWWQVLVYILNLPRVRRDSTEFHGQVAYPNGVSLPVSPLELTQERKDRIDAAVRAMATSRSPEPRPSEKECDWCDIADCAARFVPAGDEATTEAF